MDKSEKLTSDLILENKGIRNTEATEANKNKDRHSSPFLLLSAAEGSIEISRII